ncbi:ribokinase [Paenibacillus nasutitermitis]|uniref:Ribokinase n=1 Tax=Paenibacillus nasutitermitis TaxID=1652958 RepID=A0A916Z3T5_9BACL|nr:ribokinase [Paenibacillus nasutitermitis]GGD74456.1 ribokinase [Paenibacillus nasutitermitis]
MSNEHITVIGSYVVDLMCQTPHMPQTGETVLGHSFRMGEGGKGGNQATAASRLGSMVTLVTRVGNDDFGRAALAFFEKEGIQHNRIAIDPVETTGVALILVDNNGDNQIVVSLGACGQLERADIEAAEMEIANSAIMLVQLETDLAAVEASLEFATKHAVPLILNPAPFQPFDLAWLKQVTYLTPNETEASALTGITVHDQHSAMQAANKLLEYGVKNVIITLGSKGAIIKQDHASCYWFSSFEVEVADTTGAGDAFNGGLARALSRGTPLLEAMRYASAVAALSVTRMGTAAAMPLEHDVLELMHKQGNRCIPVDIEGISGVADK